MIPAGYGLAGALSRVDLPRGPGAGLVPVRVAGEHRANPPAPQPKGPDVVYQLDPNKPGDRLAIAEIERRHNPNSPWFYNRRQIDAWFERAKLKGEFEVESSNTMPPLWMPNAKLANYIHPESGVYFDGKGLPMFQPVGGARVYFGWSEWDALGYRGMMREASRRAYAAIQRGEIDGSKLDALQLEQLRRGSEKVSGYTWHHDVGTGEMQLIRERTHALTGHVGDAQRQGPRWEK